MIWFQFFCTVAGADICVGTRPDLAACCICCAHLWLYIVYVVLYATLCDAISKACWPYCIIPQGELGCCNWPGMLLRLTMLLCVCAQGRTACC
jgi:hypothetical protein